MEKKIEASEFGKAVLSAPFSRVSCARESHDSRHHFVGESVVPAAEVELREAHVRSLGGGDQHGDDQAEDSSGADSFRVVRASVDFGMEDNEIGLSLFGSLPTVLEKRALHGSQAFDHGEGLFDDLKDVGGVLHEVTAPVGVENPQEFVVHVAVLQAVLFYQAFKADTGGQGDLMSSLDKPFAEGDVGLDIASGAVCENENVQDSRPIAQP